MALAASGGLDSCTITRWLVEEGVGVVSLTADLGQPDEANIDDIPERMRAAGAEDAVLVDARDALARAGLEVIQTQAKYEGGYWNTTGIARHVTVQALLPEVQRRDITVFGHGATGRGNDQVRFQLVTNMLAPGIQVYAPWRDTEFLEQFPGRREMIVYCEREEIPIRATLDKPYSTDANLLGLTHEAGQLEELETPAQFVRPEMGVFPHEAPEDGERVAIRFEQGVPTAIDGRPVTPREAIEQANAIGGRHGVGIGLHVVENRFVGIKSRGVYEAPAMELLGTCYAYLQQLILDRRARSVFDQASAQLARQVYEGYWFDLASSAMRRSVETFTKLTTGTIVVDVYRGHVAYASAHDVPHSLYSDASSMEGVGDFDHRDSEGFLGVLGVSARALSTQGHIDSDE
ncbi:MAG: argininosuccinate synthase [Chloroflexi bacterium]|nr:argininosuccinate synthase [Chloroflexota bacterium]